MTLGGHQGHVQGSRCAHTGPFMAPSLSVLMGSGEAGCEGQGWGIDGQVSIPPLG